MITINMERRLKRLIRMLEDEVLPAVWHAGSKIAEFTTRDDEKACELELCEAELLVKLSYDKLMVLHRSVLRKLRKVRPRRLSRIQVARLRLKEKEVEGKK